MPRLDLLAGLSARRRVLDLYPQAGRRASHALSVARGLCYATQMRALGPWPQPSPGLSSCEDSHARGSAADPVYLDHNATTPVDPRVAQVVSAWVRDGWGNPSSRHPRGREAREAVEWSRHALARLIGARPEELVFTACATESNNLALFGAAAGIEAEFGRPGVLLTTAIEHPSVSGVVDVLAARGWRVRRLPVARDGRIDLECLGAVGDEAFDIVSVIAAHNETGCVQPVAELAAAVRARSPRAFVHCDASQAVGKIPVDVEMLGVDALTIAGHKFYATKGIGALYLRSGRQIGARLEGGGQEGGLRSGTECTPLIVGLGVAAELAGACLVAEGRETRARVEQLWRALSGSIPGILRISAADVSGLPNTLLVCVPHVFGRELLEHCPEVSASTGSACHEADESDEPDEPGRHAGVLAQMGVEPNMRAGALRMSVGRWTTAAEIEQAAAALTRAWQTLAGSGR